MNFYQGVGGFAGWFYTKYREQARLNGVQYAARNLRKQGVPLEHAVNVLVSVNDHRGNGARAFDAAPAALDFTEPS